MSLRRACVDRGRAVFDVEDPSQPWSEGEPFAVQETGPWFSCRLTVQEPTEITQVPGVRGPATRGYRHLEAPATLLMLPVYQDGSSVTDGEPGVGKFIAFEDGQMLQIESGASPEDEIWHVHTGIQPIRKLRRVIGFTCGLRRAREPGVPTATLPKEGSFEPPERLYGAGREPVSDGGEVGL